MACAREAISKGRHQPSVDAILDDIDHAADREGNDGVAAGHGLQQDIGLIVFQGRKHDEIGGAVGLDQFAIVDHIAEIDDGKTLFGHFRRGLAEDENLQLSRVEKLADLRSEAQPPDRGHEVAKAFAAFAVVIGPEQDSPGIRIDAQGCSCFDRDPAAGRDRFRPNSRDDGPSPRQIPPTVPPPLPASAKGRPPPHWAGHRLAASGPAARAAARKHRRSAADKARSHGHIRRSRPSSGSRP